MRSGASSVQHLLTPAALGVLKHAVTEARGRGHPQVQPLHVVSMLLTHAGSRLRQACMLSHPQNAQTAECRALEVCFNVALDHLPQSAMAAAGSSATLQQPILSNALMAALKRAHAHQRRGCPEHQQSPLLAVKVEIDQLIISILDDPSVSRVMKEAGFSSTNVKFNLEDAGAASTVTVATEPLRHVALEHPPSQHAADIVSQVGSFYDASCVISEENETKSSAKFAPVESSWPQQQQQPQCEVSSREGGSRGAKRGVVGGPPVVASRDEDVQRVLEIFLRPRSSCRNAILIGDTTTANANATVDDLALRIKNGTVPAQLQGLQFLDPKLSSSSFGFCSSLEMEQKLAELSKIVEECMPEGAILHIGDLQWLAEPMQLRKGPSNFCPAQSTASELRQLLIRHANHRLWFVGVATPHVFARLHALYPSLTSDWGLQPVQITTQPFPPPQQPTFLQRFGNNRQNVSDLPATSAMPVRSASPMAAAAAVQESWHEESNGAIAEKFQCCTDCLAKFEEQRRFIHENESLSLQLAPVKWFSLTGDEATSGATNGQVKSRSVVQQLSQLQQIWQKTCRMLHGEPMPVLTPSPRSQPQQLQSPLSRLSASSHSKPCGLDLDISSRWSGRSVVDHPLRTRSPVYTTRGRVASPALRSSVEPSANNVKALEATADLGSPKDGSSVASAPEDHEDPNGSTGTSVHDASLANIHTNLALGRANDDFRNNNNNNNNKKLRAPITTTKPHTQLNANPSPLQQTVSARSPLSLKNSGKPLWMLQSSSPSPLPQTSSQSPLQQRLVKSNGASHGGMPWQSSSLSPLAKRSSLQGSQSPSPPAAAPFKEFTVDENLKGLYKGLMQRVPWQGAAVAGISATVMKCRSGMGNFRSATAKTDTWLLLLGPDPVAKNAIAKALAELVFGGERSLLHLGFGDGSCHKLESADNGMRYRGRTPIDRLVEAVRMKQSAVILLEDIDKANSMIRSSIVRAMEIGKLADSSGREVSFSNTVVVMTSSVGSELCVPKPKPGTLSFSEATLAEISGRATIRARIKNRTSAKVISRVGRVTVVDNGVAATPTTRETRSVSVEVPSWVVTKRKPDALLIGELRPRTDGKRTKPHDGHGRFLNLDLNLATGDVDGAWTGDQDSNEYDDDDDDAKLQLVLAEARYAFSDKFCALPDYAVGFDAYDFNGLATELLTKLGNSFESCAPTDVGLQVDFRVLEHLVACVWKMPSGRPAFNSWLQDVFAKSFAEIRIPGACVAELVATEEFEPTTTTTTTTVALPHNIVFSSAV